MLNKTLIYLMVNEFNCSQSKVILLFQDIKKSKYIEDEWISEF